MKIKFDSERIEKAVLAVEKDFDNTAWVPVNKALDLIKGELQNRIKNVDAGMTGGIDIDGAPLKDNQPGTITKKRKARQMVSGDVKSLYATGHMVNDIKKDVNKAEASGTLSLPADRVIIAGHLQKRGYTNWWGIPLAIHQRPTPDVFRGLLNSWIKGILNRAKF